MAKPDKKMEAIIELYESEKHYLKDLSLWIDMIKRNILGASSLELNRRYSYFSSILSHITAIYDLHMRIFQKLMGTNSYALRQSTSTHLKPEDLLQDFDIELLRQEGANSDDLEYYSVYNTMLDSFSCYVKYFEDLPKVEYYFKKLMFTDRYFKGVVGSYMSDNDMTDLGINHFIYRPSAKISRYPIFFKAIAKREASQQKKKEYEDVARSFDKLIKHLEGIFEDRKTQFETFILSYRLVFGDEVRNKFSLGLVYRKNKLLMSKKIIVKKNRLKPASYKDVYLFNRMILICLTAENEFENVVIDDDPIFLSKLYLVKSGIDDFAPNENLEKLYPLFLVQKNRSIKALYFSDDTNREIFYESVRKAIKSVRGCIDKSIKIKELVRHEEDLNCVCKPESGRNAFISSHGVKKHQNSENSGSSEYIEYRTDDQDSRKRDSTVDDDNSKECSDDAKGSGMNSSYRKKHQESESSGSVIFGASSVYGDIVISDVNQGSSKDGEKHANNEYDENSDSLPLKEISSCAYSSQLELDGSDALDRETENQIMYNFDRFGVEDDVPSDASSISSKTYLDIFPEDGGPSSETDVQSSPLAQDNSGSNVGFFSEIFKHTSISLNQMAIQHSYQYGRAIRNRMMLIYSNRNGIFRELHKKDVLSEDARDLMIYDKPAQKILYDPDLELLIFQSGEYAYISGFHADSARLQPQEINTPIKSVFYGKLKSTAYIALVTNEEYSFSIIHLLKVEYNRERSLLEIKVIRKLYVGFVIFNIFFLEGRIIISCKDFELVEIDTLRTQELLEAYDTSISLLLGSKEYFEARSIFKLDVNTFLLCFNGGGYLIDRTGSYKYNNVSFSWEILGEEFKIFRKWIIVVGQSYVTIFEIETGKMIFMEHMPGMRLVEGTKVPLMYSKTGIYLIDFGEACHDEYRKHKIYEFESIQESEETVNLSEACDSSVMETLAPGSVSGVSSLKEDTGTNAAIDSFFFHSFSSQSLLSDSNARCSSVTLECNGPHNSSRRIPVPHSSTATSSHYTTHKADMGSSRSRHREYVPGSTETSRSLHPSNAPTFKRPVSQGSQSMFHDALHGQSERPRSFKMKPRGDYKIDMPSRIPPDLVPKARERKMKILRKYSRKKKKAWIERNSGTEDGKIDEMDIIDRYYDGD